MQGMQGRLGRRGRQARQAGLGRLGRLGRLGGPSRLSKQRMVEPRTLIIDCWTFKKLSKLPTC